MKVLYKSLISFGIVVLILIIFTSLYKPLNDYLVFLNSLFYWLVFLVLIVALGSRQLTSRKILKASLVMIIIGAILSTIGQPRIAEIILRLAFIGWIIGLINSIRKYMANNGK